jgi:CBS domain-containing protein
MKLDKRVAEVMTKNVVAIERDQPLFKIVELFRKNKVRHIPVLGDKNVVGIISRTDINRLTFGALFESSDSQEETILEFLTIPQVMSSNPKVVNANEPLKKVAEIFAHEEFHALPVVEEGKLVGIITTTDVIRMLLEEELA